MERASEPGWEDQEALLVFFIFLSLAGSSPSSCRALDRRSLEAGTSPLRRDGMLEPEGSVAAGLGGGAWPIPSPPPPNSQGTGGGGGPQTCQPHTNWALGLEACGEGLPGPSRPKGCLSSPSLRPALLFGAEAPELSEGRHSPSWCSSVWLVFWDPCPFGPGRQAPSLLFCLTCFAVTFPHGTQGLMSP